MKTKKTTLAQEFIHWQRVDPFCQEAGWVDKTRNVPLALTVAEVSTSGLVILPKEKGTVLNVPGLVIQPAETEEALPGTRRFPVASTARGCDSKVSTAGRPAGPSNFRTVWVHFFALLTIDQLGDPKRVVFVPSPILNANNLKVANFPF